MRQVTHALLTRPPLSQITLLPERIQVKCFARLACVRHAASVHPEPGSNSRIKNLGLVFSDLMFVCAPHVLNEVSHEFRTVGASVCSESRINLLANSFPLYCVWHWTLDEVFHESSVKAVRPCRTSLSNDVLRKSSLQRNFQGLLSIVQLSRF